MHYPTESVTAVLNSFQKFANLDGSPTDKTMMCNF